MKFFKKRDYDVEKRAKELHEKLGEVTQDKTTTSVGYTEEEIGIVGSSEGKLRKVIKQELFDFEIEASGEFGKHAEEYVIEEAEKQNLHLTEIAASREICLDCQVIIEEKGIEPKTGFSGEKSKKRK